MEAVDADCYTRSGEAAWIASDIHRFLLKEKPLTENPIPMELRAVLLPIPDDKLEGCIASLQHGE